MELAVKIVSAGLMLLFLAAFLNFIYWQAMLVGNVMNESERRKPGIMKRWNSVHINVPQREALLEVFDGDQYTLLRRKWARSLGLAILSFGLLAGWAMVFGEQSTS